MSPINNPLEIYKITPKTNCRQCDTRTCLAFADAVFKGQKKLNECPYLDDEIINRFDGKFARPVSIEEQQEQFLEQMKKEIVKVDFASSAERLGASFSDGKLAIKALGKKFFVDPKGNITSECHINTWLTVPILNYIITCQGKDLSGKWVPFRELKNGKARQPLFGQRCEKPIQDIADKHPDLFFDYILYIFEGKQVETGFSSDNSFILHPLPKVPLLINYNEPEDDLDSSLTLFFDAKAEDNLNIEGIHGLCSGLVMMFEKIVQRHG